MRILQVHNIYIGKTGEEAVVNEEKKILEENGHQVIQYIKNNSDINDSSKLAKAKLLLSLTSSKTVALEFEELLNTECPDICHVHNTFPLITPVIYQVCKRLNVPVVQTLHNYKMICTNSLLFRDGKVCEQCLNKNLYNSIKFKCYRNSHLATAAQAHVIQYHRKKGTWDNLIDKYICLTEFQRDKLVSGGLKREQTVVKPNFLSYEGRNIQREDFFLFVGRLNDSKGLQDLLHLFRHNKSSQFILIGKSDNPEVFREFDNVTHLGERDREDVLEYMSRCKAVIFPSIYYEGMPIVILEAFAHKKTVITRNTGAMSTMIGDGFNGLKYEQITELVEKVEHLQHDDKLAEQLGNNAFQDYCNKYSKERGYENLLKVYASVLHS
ncbi:glycosyltransferase family 4 protein [Roseivirga sp. E12]|uniref:glycosyltransferase family 4 protein n=1 Tax=Roseivirga sp. E12 TaxID=2819237 RepID=UPI001ABC576B|nr:glycosyltransferase family 4 protein [Roseivirga sp. E12]MBO3699734.1 glycosyltransferase family 4 protein [Roseivirga sp. E12]